MFTRQADVAGSAVAAYSAKAALFTAATGDRGTFFDSTGSFTITLDTTNMVAGWSAWFRCVSGTQTLDPSGATLINGAATYAVSNAGDTVLVEYTGSAFVVSHTQRPSTVAISGGTINGTPIGGSTPAAGAFTTVSATGVITSTLATGTAPFTVASTTVVGNLNVSQLLGSTWAAPGTIGSGTPSSGAFTTLSATGVITSTLATGTAPFTVASTTVVGNLNVSQLLGATWTAPGTIGSGTPSSGAFTTLTASGITTITNATDSSSIATGAVVISGGLGVAKKSFFGDKVAIAAANAANSLTVAGASGQYAAVITANSTSGSSFGMQVLGGTNSSDQCVSFYNQTGGTSLLLIAGNGAASGSGVWSFTNGSASTSTTTGAVKITGGVGVTGNITFDGTSGASLRVTNSTANALVATTLGSVGPTGSTAGTPQAWLRISVAGTDRYIPMW